MLAILLILSISLYFAWRYSKTEIDPDWALFNLPAFVGSWYGRDYPDCKTPAIYYWYYGLAKMVGINISHIKFAHHLLMGSSGLIVYLLTGSLASAVAFSVLINSGWLLAFHGNVSQLPAICMAVALGIHNPWVGVIALGLAVFNEPKLILAAMAVAVLNNWWIPVAVFAAAGLVFWFFYLRKTMWYQDILESAWIIPRRIGKSRMMTVKRNLWFPWFTAQATLYILPWITVAVISRPDWKLWVPAILYGAVLAYSRVVRQNHLILLAAWIAYAGIDLWFVVALIAWDFMSAGLYLGDIWNRMYTALRDVNIDARRLGEWLLDKEGSIWVNHYHTAVYLYARHPIVYNMTEQCEINDVAHERRDIFLDLYKKSPPDYVVNGSGGLNFNGIGYKLVARQQTATIWKKVGG